MIMATFYRSALERGLNEPTTRLFESLLARNERIGHLRNVLAGPEPRSEPKAEEIYEAIGENTSVSSDINSLQQQVKLFSTTITFESLLLRGAFENEQSALKREQEMWETCKARYKAICREIVELRAANVREFKAFMLS